MRRTIREASSFALEVALVVAVPGDPELVELALESSPV
jgi:hypothetical protein